MLGFPPPQKVWRVQPSATVTSEAEVDNTEIKADIVQQCNFDQMSRLVQDPTMQLLTSGQNFPSLVSTAVSDSLGECSSTFRLPSGRKSPRRSEHGFRACKSGHKRFIQDQLDPLYYALSSSPAVQPSVQPTQSVQPAPNDTGRPAGSGRPADTSRHRPFSPAGTGCPADTSRHRPSSRLRPSSPEGTGRPAVRRF